MLTKSPRIKRKTSTATLLSILLILVLLCSSLVLSVKAEVITWHQTYGGPWFDKPSSLIATSGGGYAIAGTFSNSFSGDHDPELWLIKTDAFGNVLWNKTYGRPDYFASESLIATSDGGYAIVGYVYTTTNNGDVWLVKTDAYGNMEWNKTYGGQKLDRAYSLVQASDGGYVFAGVTESFAWLVKVDAYGNTEWNRTYSGAANSLVATSDGGYAFAGYLEHTVVWNSTYGGPWDGVAYSLVATSDGGYAVAGYTESFGAGDETPLGSKSASFWLIKTDAFGNMHWDQTYGGTETDKAWTLVAASDGGYAIAGNTLSFGDAGYADILLIKTDEYGVAPEAPWVVLPVLLAATLAIFICKKKLLPAHKMVPL